ncbi:separin [Anthonomus grandis grandis]|uniref:separin n=1 Tax=Anthonomus grandis grandis TaxID=2921223 RepID=UPI0021662F86|nr:separin [Anthonomus grandis grandis]
MATEMLDIDSLLKEITGLRDHSCRNGFSHQRVQKFKVLNSDTNERQKILHLIDSHVPSLRETAGMQFTKIIEHECLGDMKEYFQMLKDVISTKCTQGGMDEVLKQQLEMPKEWTVIQITHQINPVELQSLEPSTYETNGIDLVVFNCGQENVEPFLVSLSSPPSLNGQKFELLQKLMDVLKLNSEMLTSTSQRHFFKNKREKYDYMQRQEDTELTVQELVREAEHNWLREWRCLLVGKFQSEEAEEEVRGEVWRLARECLKGHKLNGKDKELLYYIIKGADRLTTSEISEAIKLCCGDLCQNTAKDLVRMIKEINVKINCKYDMLPRHPVILVLDESLDAIPWEMMEIFNGEPVTRIPSWHFVYYLFKAHEKHIKNGLRVISRPLEGKFIINPDGDLVQMEKRMVSFFNYWLKGWTGINGRKPTSDEFYDYLEQSDVFSYSGHGNGTHLYTIDILKRKTIKSVVLLFGCASTKIARQGPQLGTYGSYHIFLIARAPCVLGMLWPVTDTVTDLLTTGFLSSWLPSEAPIHWSQVDKKAWKKGGPYDNFSAIDVQAPPINSNLELLRALWSAKSSLSSFFTKAACVVRGLPVKIAD